MTQSAIEGIAMVSSRYNVEELESRRLLSASLIRDVGLDQKSSNFYTLGRIGTKAIFAYDDKVRGMELYRNDGTAGGTFLLKDIFVGAKSSNPKFVGTAGDFLFFSAN